MYFVCLLANQHTTFKWKGVILVFQFSNVVQIHKSGEVGNYTIFQLPTFYETFLPKIIKIQLCLLELQLKNVGDPFYET